MILHFPFLKDIISKSKIKHLCLLLLNVFSKQMLYLYILYLTHFPNSFLLNVFIQKIKQQEFERRKKNQYIFYMGFKHNH